MNFRSKDLSSIQTFLVLGLIALLSGASAQDAQPANIPNNNNDNNPVIVDPNGNPLPPSTVKTTTIRTDAPTTRPTIKTTLGPRNRATTGRAFQTFKWTDPGPTKNYNLLFTSRKPHVDGNPGGVDGVDGTDGNAGSTGTGHTIRHNIALLGASVFTLLVALFFCR